MPSIAGYWRAVAVMLACHAPLAYAELWAFVDDAGVTHFASERLDDRYELFFKGRTSLNGEGATNDPQAALERTPLYRRVVDHPNARRFASLIERTAHSRALDPALVKAVIAVESAYEPNAISAKGAMGLMQIIPATAQRYGLVARPDRTIEQQLLDPSINVRIGVRYLRDLLDRFEDDLSLALAAYNAGEQSVRESGNRIPPFPETREYVLLVRQFQTMYAPPAPGTAKSPRPRIELRTAHNVRTSDLPAP
ncbi:MAG TPA: lytic transglycosylase domain-containing protein [Casimicrobiaceae bacterium]|jgi:soluble lytic murein transglycosylase-like protein